MLLAWMELFVVSVFGREWLSCGEAKHRRHEGCRWLQNTIDDSKSSYLWHQGLKGKGEGSKEKRG